MTDREQYAPGPDRRAQFRRLWSARVDGLEGYLDRMDQSTNEKEDTEKATRPKPRT